MFEIAIEILNILNDYESYIVGGYPRNKYLNIESTDIDICSSATPKQVSKLFKKYKINNFGSILVYYKNYKFEITTFRKEIEYLDNRHPSKFVYVKSLEEDLKRRDFIINTLCIDKNKKIIDLLDAKQDLDNKIIRTVGNPYLKIQEDALRILRAVRFAATLNFKLDNKLKYAIKKYNHLLDNLSKERKKYELDKIFKTNPKYGIELFKELNLNKYLNINDIIITDNYLGIWAQIDGYPLTKNEKNNINKIKKIIKEDINNYTLYKYGLELNIIAGQIKHYNISDIKEKYNKLPIKNRTDIDISLLEINDLINNYKKSNNILNDIELKILNNELNNNKKTLIEFIKTY